MMWSLWITTFTHYSALKIRSIQFSEARHALMPVSWEMLSPAFKCSVDTHTHGHRQSARTTQVLNVRNWPWLYIPNKPSTSSLLANGLVTWLWYGIGFHLNENQTLWSSVPLRVISGQKSRSCFGFRPTDKVELSVASSQLLQKSIEADIKDKKRQSNAI